ncbi:hypothetical protein Pla175_27060 [Pirellulimonas nuda]|uniref:Uncharacterized protein n=1 Tax=Pirellulimonas nuda TaxID=2528009 RepID=A0A518DCV9_9BACT|nr:hypothetical protein [Pirellulimonas nuda]QDU89317.1 hypothetical protein Pla175_27060 [Pirellulimonas nuda]
MLAMFLARFVTNRCTLCDLELGEQAAHDSDPDVCHCRCPDCGSYAITQEAAMQLDRHAWAAGLANLAAAIRDANQRGERPLVCLANLGPAMSGGPLGAGNAG